MRLEIDEHRLGLLFPAYLIIDRSLTLLAIGPSILRRSPEMMPGTPLADHFAVHSWLDTDSLDRLSERDEPLQLRCKRGKIILSGMVVRHEDRFVLAMNNIPAAFSIDAGDLQISDFGPSDPTVAGLMLVGMQKALLEEARTVAMDLNRERQRTLDLLDQISRTSGYMAHDFNNLLSIINLNSDRLLKSEGLTAAQQRLLRIIIETAERGTDITRSLMTLSHQQNDSRMPMAVDALIDDHKAFFATIAGVNAKLSCHLDAGYAVLDISRSGLLNCLLNIIINSRDAMPDGGEITISTCVKMDAMLAPGGKGQPSPTPCVAIEVADSGVGMDPEVLSRAFEPLFSTKPQGTGTGLASVLEFAREMGGDACLDSQPGKGTAVHIYLPLSTAGAGEGDQAGSPEQTGIDGQGTKILIAEDEPYALEALAEILEADNYRVTCAASGAEALAALKADSFDLLLSDVVMPEMSGLDLAVAARSIAPGIGVILMSGYVPDSSEMQPEWLFIRKPLDIALLLDMLRSALQSSQAQAAIPI